MFTNKKKESINTFVCAASLYVAETPKTWTKDHESSLPIMLYGIVAYGFVGQPFSRQLCLCAVYFIRGVPREVKKIFLKRSAQNFNVIQHL